MEKGCVLVTGGAGFIGSFTVERLLLEGYEVSVLDDFSSGSMKNLERMKSNAALKIFRGSITKLDEVERAVRNVDFVVHEAAIASVQESIENPMRVNEVNVTGTLNILKASLDSKVKRLVFASSCAIYGDPDKLPVSENHSRRAISPYGVSKLSAEAYCSAFYETYGFETVVLRYFNVYGPHQGYNPYSGVITTF
ncbi:SDR family NAD(P)-dependent oxidoreductase, partial [Candidatus Bathyarchaeota archaeon]|nr:SDR family NAD(P)-dependent oxidoreductase [Candidatus Bathyarchaeota archaeon]